MNFDEERGAFGQTLRGSLGMDLGEGVDLVIVPEYRIERIVWIRRRDGKVVGGDFRVFELFIRFLLFLFSDIGISLYILCMYTCMFLKLSIIFNRRLYEGTIIFWDAKKVISIELRSFERKALNGRMLIFFFFFCTKELILAERALRLECLVSQIVIVLKFGWNKSSDIISVFGHAIKNGI